MDLLRSQINLDSVNWADEQFVKTGLSSLDGSSGLDDMERHIAECMWALIVKRKRSGQDVPNSTKVFFRLTKLLCDVGLSEDEASGLFLPMRKHVIQDSCEGREEVSDSTVDLLPFPPSNEGSYEEHAQLVHESPIRDSYLWAPLCCATLFNSSLTVSDNVLDFVNHFASTSLSPAHAVVEDISAENRILTEEEGIAFLSYENFVLFFQ